MVKVPGTFSTGSLICPATAMVVEPGRNPHKNRRFPSCFCRAVDPYSREIERQKEEAMNLKQIAVVCSMVLCTAGIVSAQTEWVEHPDARADCRAAMTKAAAGSAVDIVRESWFAVRDGRHGAGDQVGDSKRFQGLCEPFEQLRRIHGRACSRPPGRSAVGPSPDGPDGEYSSGSNELNATCRTRSPDAPRPFSSAASRSFPDQEGRSCLQPGSCGHCTPSV